MRTLALFWLTLTLLLAASLWASPRYSLPEDPVGVWGPPTCGLDATAFDGHGKYKTVSCKSPFGDMVLLHVLPNPWTLNHEGTKLLYDCSNADERIWKERDCENRRTEWRRQFDMLYGTGPVDPPETCDRECQRLCLKEAGY
jgi:hypothetical protein